ncbi:MAG: hypothetical protein V9E88_07865 [Ferruginibacter sp.]
MAVHFLQDTAIIDKGLIEDTVAQDELIEEVIVTKTTPQKEKV